MTDHPDVMRMKIDDGLSIRCRVPSPRHVDQHPFQERVGEAAASGQIQLAQDLIDDDSLPGGMFEKVGEEHSRDSARSLRILPPQAPAETVRQATELPVDARDPPEGSDPVRLRAPDGRKEQVVLVEMMPQLPQDSLRGAPCGRENDTRGAHVGVRM
jgi:hypothetical protein